MKPEPNPAILDYIRTNRSIYAREAIEHELRSKGHSDEEIVAAWSAVEVEPTSADRSLSTRSDISRSPGFWLTWLVGSLLFTVAVFGWDWLGGPDWSDIYLNSIVGMVFLGFGLIFLRRFRIFGLGILMAVITVMFLPWVAVLIAVGRCFVQEPS